MPDRHPNIITSGLSRTVTVDGVTVVVNIYRLEDDAQWVLEVVNEVGTSTVWDMPPEPHAGSKILPWYGSITSTISFTMDEGVKYSPPFCMKAEANSPMKYSKIRP